MKESAAEPQKIRRKNSVSEVIGRCDSGIGASIRENEEKHMITGEVEAVDRKQKIRDRYKGVDRLKKKVNIVQLTFNSSFAKSLVSMYAFPAKVLKKLSVNGGTVHHYALSPV